MPTDALKREKPKVPNHEMVRVIGAGSYGEIWLALSLTGTWRAVKIVDRRNFESDRAFDREFEGMARFEPISRGDAGFVDILHVGRDEGGNFFYYVMELADDHIAGGHIEPDRYIPKTLKTELARRSRLLADECITIGLSLTKALAALHAQGLVHRDIKPANIIFVGGVPKIADIGLVADSGQRSFVGTEGYVPPEGPGTVQADIFSLGKVLYELAMGKDRLDFPAVNSRLADLPDKEALMRLNEVLFRACANEPRDRYATAGEMIEDIERIRDRRPLSMRGRRRWPAVVASLLLLLLCGGGWLAHGVRSARGGVTIESDPPGAMVVLASTMKHAPATFTQLRVGTHSVRVMLAGFEPVDMPVQIESGVEAHPAVVHLARSTGTARIASEPNGASFEIFSDGQLVESGTAPRLLSALPTGDYEVHARLDGREQRATFEVKRGETTVKEMEFPSGKIVVKSDPAGAEISVDGKPAGRAPLELSLPEGSHEFSAQLRKWPPQKSSAMADHAAAHEVAFNFARGSVKLTSAPGGASVFVDGNEIGQTPFFAEGLEPGDVLYELRLAGFKNLEVHGVVKGGGQTFLAERFVKRAGPMREEPWENSLGMRFVPVGEVLMSAWLTRVQDYDAFCAATGRARPVPDFPQDATHPVVKVNWDDAQAFCEWLTKKEIAEEKLEDGQLYRLPTDAEWSLGVGLPDEGRSSPEERDGKMPGYPWGPQWPPPSGFGNYADVPPKRSAPVIAGFKDGFVQTSPVGSFKENRLGLFDMGGNVWQWCLEPYKPGARWGVVRGGSWANAAPGELRSSYRNVIDRSERDVIYGFRCVLVPDGAPTARNDR